MTIADAKHRVTLRQGETTWQVAERSGYPADFGALRDTVIKLSRLKIGRRFAGTPESLVRLSLMAPTATTDKGRGQSITLKDAQGKVLADVILGQVRKTEGGGERRPVPETRRRGHGFPGGWQFSFPENHAAGMAGG